MDPEVQSALAKMMGHYQSLVAASDNLAAALATVADNLSVAVAALNTVHDALEHAEDVELTMVPPINALLGDQLVIAEAFSYLVKPTPPTPPAPPAPPPVDPAKIPTGDLPGWKESYAQDFNTPAALKEITSKYHVDMRGYSGFLDTFKKGMYAPDKTLTVADGKLRARMHTLNGVPQIACMIPMTYDKPQLYGRYVVRVRADKLPGYKLAWMLWPNSNRWMEGEVDFIEIGLDGTSGLCFYSHEINNPTANAHWFKSGPNLTEWHTIALDWTPTKLELWVDGKSVSSTTNPKAIPTTPMRLTLQCETDGSGKYPDPAVAGNIELDWIKVYSYNPTTTTPSV